jgi:hypothetical protein
VHIESDNMARHEWPICRELGLPYRQNYRDVNVTSDGAPSMTSQIRRKIEHEAKLQREKAEAEAKRKGQIAANKCGWCQLVFPNRASLADHKMRCPKKP